MKSGIILSFLIICSLLNRQFKNPFLLDSFRWLFCENFNSGYKIFLGFLHSSLISMNSVLIMYSNWRVTCNVLILNKNTLVSTYLEMVSILSFIEWFVCIFYIWVSSTGVSILMTRDSRYCCPPSWFIID